MIVALYIAAGLLFAAGYALGAGIARRKWFDEGYGAAQIDLADDAAIAETLRPEIQREVAWLQ